MVSVILLAGCGGAPELVPTPNLYADSEVDPFAATPSWCRANTVEVLYATNRQCDYDQIAIAYGSARSRATAYGSCTITMGEGTTWDELVAASRVSKRPSSIGIKLTNIRERGYYPARDELVEIEGAWREDPRYLSGVAAVERNIHAMLAEQLAQTSCKEIFLFVHGYNNTFEESAIRIAEIWHFMGRVGVPVVFSWPAGSTGLLRGYTRDRESGEFSVAHFKQFLRTLASCPEVSKINIVAHSRGNDVMTTALRELHIACAAAGRDTRAELKLSQIVLAAPDIDLDVVIERFSSERLGLVPDQLTVYVSPKDKALNLATFLFGSTRRLGQLRYRDMNAALARAMKSHPVVRIVNVKAKSGFLGHGYVTENPAVLSDIILVLRDKLQPGAHHGRPLGLVDGLWQLPDGYPGQTATPKNEK